MANHDHPIIQLVGQELHPEGWHLNRFDQLSKTVGLLSEDLPS